MFGKRSAERQAAREREAMEAAGAYLVAGIADDQPGIEDAVSRVDTFLLQAAVVDIAQRAVSALAQERGVGLDEVMASLIWRRCIVGSVDALNPFRGPTSDR